MYSHHHSVILLLAVLSSVCTHPEYMDEIPNGDKIPHPCNETPLVQGIGHLELNGGGQLNKFGNDFNNIREWKELCKLDSDGDGMSNGEELGDPRCVWTKGDTPERTVGISHPGVCTSSGKQTCNALTDCNKAKVEDDLKPTTKRNRRPDWSEHQYSSVKSPESLS